MSIQRETSDNKHYVLFLSGVLDARKILAALPFAIACYIATFNTEGNREFIMATKPAVLEGSRHSRLNCLMITLLKFILVHYNNQQVC